MTNNDKDQPANLCSLFNQLVCDLLNQDLSFFENTVDPDQLASEEAI